MAKAFRNSSERIAAGNYIRVRKLDSDALFVMPANMVEIV